MLPINYYQDKATCAVAYVSNGHISRCYQIVAGSLSQLVFLHGQVASLPVQDFHSNFAVLAISNNDI